jgi:hypothetical protein
MPVNRSPNKGIGQDGQDEEKEGNEEKGKGKV